MAAGDCDDLTKSLGTVFAETISFHRFCHTDKLPPLRCSKAKLQKLLEGFSLVTYGIFKKPVGDKIFDLFNKEDFPILQNQHWGYGSTLLDVKNEKVVVGDFEGRERVSFDDGRVNTFAVYAEKYLITGGEYGLVLLWRIYRQISEYPANPVPLYNLGGAARSIKALCVTNRDIVLGGGDSGNLFVWDPKNVRYRDGRTIKPMISIKIPADIIAICELEEGKVAVSCHTGDIYIANLNNPKMKPFLLGHAGNCFRGGVSYDGKKKILSSFGSSNWGTPGKKCWYFQKGRGK